MDPIIIISATLSLLVGVTILLYPKILYYCVAAYLAIAGILALYYGAADHAHVSYHNGYLHFAIISLLAAVLIAVFPDIVSYVFGVYLIILAILMYIGAGATFPAAFTLLMAVILLIFPDFIAWIVGTYFILNGLLPFLLLLMVHPVKG